MDIYLPENVLNIYSAVVPIACCDWLGFDLIFGEQNGLQRGCLVLINSLTNTT
jgi:hypothetical protein